MSTRSVGAAAEARAAGFLESLGYRVLARNVTTRQGELDLVCEADGHLCFVEVRSRAHARLGLPEETIGRTKRERIARAAAWWLMRHPTDQPCRFDVVSIVGDATPTLIRDAFRLGE